MKLTKTLSSELIIVRDWIFDKLGSKLGNCYCTADVNDGSNHNVCRMGVEFIN